MVPEATGPSHPGCPASPARRPRIATDSVRRIDEPADPGDTPRSEFLRPPLWRTRTTPQRRATGAALTFVVVVIVGAIPAVVTIGLLRRLGAPDWLASTMWLVPTAIVLVWSLWRPGPAIATDDDDATWVGYAVRYVLVGADERRPAPVRAVAAALFGAPVGWAYAMFFLLQLSGLA